MAEVAQTRAAVATLSGGGHRSGRAASPPPVDGRDGGGGGRRGWWFAAGASGGRPATTQPAYAAELATGARATRRPSGHLDGDGCRSRCGWRGPTASTRPCCWATIFRRPPMAGVRVVAHRRQRTDPDGRARRRRRRTAPRSARRGVCSSRWRGASPSSPRPARNPDRRHPVRERGGSHRTLVHRRYGRGPWWQTGPVDEEGLAGGVANAGAVTRVGDHVLRPSNRRHAVDPPVPGSVAADGFDGASDTDRLDPDGRGDSASSRARSPIPPYPCMGPDR